MLELRQMARSCRRRWSPAQVMKLCLAWSVWVLATEMELVGLGLVLVLTQALAWVASSEEPPTEAAMPTSPQAARRRDS